MLHVQTGKMKKIRMTLYIFVLFYAQIMQSNRVEANQPCKSDFGECIEGQTSCSTCEAHFEGSITAICRNGIWTPIVESCVSPNILTLLSNFKRKRRPSNEMMNIDNIANTNVHLSTTDAVPPMVINSFSLSNDMMNQCAAVSDATKVVRNESATAGNIATIVTLLNYIAQECFIAEKMQSFASRGMMRAFDGTLPEAFDGTLTAESDAQDYSAMASHILNSSTIPNWLLVPERNASWVLLGSLHKLALSLVNGNFLSSNVSIYQDFLQLKAKKITEDSNFTFQFNNTRQPVSGEILMKSDEHVDHSNLSAVSMAFTTLGKILPTESENLSVNGLVMSVVLSRNLSSVLLRFEKINKASNITSHCTAWDRESEKWSQQACLMQGETRDYTICKCNYSENFLSFSVMMSPKSVNNPILHYISIIGLSISICSLVLCLVIEAMVWKHVTKHKTAYMRHVAIVNIAVSLLFGDTWFIVSSIIDNAKSKAACIAATYFDHFFYLSLFFWMLILALLILYRIVLVYHDMRRTVMLCISFLLGYGCPFIICILTVAITLNQPDQPYTRKYICWLNWDESKALLAFIIPVFIIIAINAIIMVIVIVILLRPSLGENPRSQERSSIVQVGRCVAILTPLFGLTWGIGIATIVESSSIVFEYIFTILNSLQGLLILILGTLTDRKVLETLHSTFSPVSWITSQSKNNTSNSAQSEQKK